MESKLFEVKSYAKEKIPYTYYATKEDLDNKELWSAKPAYAKNKNGYYQTGRITAYRSE